MFKGVSANKRVFNARFTKARGVYSKVVLKLFLVHKVTKRFNKSQRFPPPTTCPTCLPVLKIRYSCFRWKETWSYLDEFRKAKRRKRRWTSEGEMRRRRNNRIPISNLLLCTFLSKVFVNLCSTELILPVTPSKVRTNGN